MAQSVHFNKIAKKQNIDFMPIFFSLKGSTVLTIKNHETKSGGQSIRFCGRAAESAHQMHFLEMGMGRVSK